MTIADNELYENLLADGCDIVKWKGKYQYGVRGIQSRLRSLGLLGATSHTKRIPAIYLNGCVDDRLAILQGLMDTDGYADTRGHCSYCSVNRGLADDVQYIVRSLGGKASVAVKNRKSGLSYEVNIRMPDSGITNERLFRLARKADRCKDKAYNGGISDVTRRIVSIEPDGEAECTCISVDNEERLYVADGFTVTHNTHIVRIKAIGAALVGYPGIKILIMRKTYNELEENHIRPILRMVSPELFSYNNTSHLMTFENGSTIKFGHWSGEESFNEYNGLEYDWIFIDEATQFTERAFNFLGGCLRGVNDIPKRMYLTCNPGGVGHAWVKRLFIDRDFKRSANPEEDENPDDYTFIFAKAEDNTFLLKSSPLYLKNLAQMPEELRRAYRDGDWDSIGGNYFPEMLSGRNVTAPFKIPQHWTRYRSFDYGLDMFACFWWAVDEDGRCWCYRSFEHEGLIVKDAAKAALDHTLANEQIIATYAPPDMWNRQKETGKTMAELFLLNGVNIVRSDNNRVQGHMVMKDMMAPIALKDPYVQSLYTAGQAPDRLPGLMFFDGCKKAISDLKAIQQDDKNPNDCAKDPHEITHTVDGIRYFCVTRVISGEALPELQPEDDEDEDGDSYEHYMCGGSADARYLL